MTTATPLPSKRRRGFGWLAQLPVPAGLSPSIPMGHPTQATVRWS